MKNDAKWFLFLALENNLTKASACQKLLEELGSDVSLVDLAQEFLDRGICQDYSSIQQLVDRAHQLANKSNAAPELPELDSTATICSDLTLPPLAEIEGLKLEEAGYLLQGLLGFLRRNQASDFHLSAGSAPFWRRNGKLGYPDDRTPLSSEAADKLNTALLTEKQKEQLEMEGDVNFVLEFDGRLRYRGNVSKHKEGICGTYHIVPEKISNLEELGFHSTKAITQLMDNHNGLVLVTGPVGAGKTSTLAALVDVINHNRYAHVIDLEAPIEIVHPTGTCFITQREVNKHTESYATALRAALREDPDIIVIGEMHDLETMEIAITAAETGHLVLATLHTRDAASTLNRLIGVFPSNQQSQIRAILSESLRGIICQQFLPSADGDRRVLVHELLIADTAVSNLIREGKMHLLEGIMQTGASHGMRSFDHSLLSLYKRGQITAETARGRIHSKDALNRLKRLAEEKQREAEKPPPPPSAAPPSNGRRYL